MSLVAEGVSVRFGGLSAIDGVSFTLEPGEILGLIGPNGAGKTTLVNVLSGFQRPSAGEVRLEERRIVGAAPDAFARAGVARTFQAVRLFKRLSVSENLEVSLVANGLSRRRARERASALLAEFSLGDRGRMPAATLTYGEERKVGIARALAFTAAASSWSSTIWLSFLRSATESMCWAVGRPSLSARRRKSAPMRQCARLISACRRTHLYELSSRSGPSRRGSHDPL
jgi:ABC-type hemin transport system ATPase subunit